MTSQTNNSCTPCLRYADRLYHFRLQIISQSACPWGCGRQSIDGENACTKYQCFGKTDTQPSVDPVSSIKDQTERQNQEVLEDELEEGCLCKPYYNPCTFAFGGNNVLARGHDLVSWTDVRTGLFWLNVRIRKFFREISKG